MTEVRIHIDELVVTGLDRRPDELVTAITKQVERTDPAALRRDPAGTLRAAIALAARHRGRP